MVGEVEQAVRLVEEGLRPAVRRASAALSIGSTLIPTYGRSKKTAPRNFENWQNAPTLDPRESRRSRALARSAGRSALRSFTSTTARTAAARRSVLDAAIAMRTGSKAAPMRFFVLEWQGRVDRARAPRSPTFSTRPPTGWCSRRTRPPASRSRSARARLAAGDEIADHRSRLSRVQEPARAARPRAWRAPRDRADRRCRSIRTPRSTRSTRAVTPRTKIALLDHITSPTARDHAARSDRPARSPGAASGRSIDGAHAPGQIELDVAALRRDRTTPATTTSGCARRSRPAFSSPPVPRSRSSRRTARARSTARRIACTPSSTGPARTIRPRSSAVPTALATLAAVGTSRRDRRAQSRARDRAARPRDRRDSAVRRTVTSSRPMHRSAAMAAIPIALPPNVDAARDDAAPAPRQLGAADRRLAGPAARPDLARTSTTRSPTPPPLVAKLRRARRQPRTVKIFTGAPRPLT